MSARKFHGAASGYYGSALAASPDNLEARLGLARTLSALHQNDAALEQYQELMRRAPGDARIKLEGAQLLLKQHKLTDAGLLFNQVLALNRSFLPPLTARLEPTAARKYAAVLTAISNAQVNSWSTAPTGSAQAMESPLTAASTGIARHGRDSHPTTTLRRSHGLFPTRVAIESGRCSSPPGPRPIAACRRRPRGSTCCHRGSNPHG